MKQEAQRIAIAKACGWTPTLHGAWTRDPAGIAGPHFFDIPDYLNDLNAMHEAEKVLTAEQTSIYRQHLQEMFWFSLHAPTPAICATASQRAEAFLRTLNLWID